MMKIRTKKLLTCILFCLFMQGCHAQHGQEKKVDCNRTTADKTLQKRLPKGICIPPGKTIDEIISNIDFNGDGEKDIVVRYSDYPLMTGVERFYGFFQKAGDTTFLMKKELVNIYPPYLKNIFSANTGADSIAANLAKNYPYDLKIEFVADSLKISHLIPDYYGKTYDFVFDRTSENWHLAQIRYWIGGLDERDIEALNLNPKLVNKNFLETKLPQKKVTIDQFNLIESRRVADTQERAYLMTTYDLRNWTDKN